MATELTVVLRFNEEDPVPTEEDLEYQLECVVIEYDIEEV